MDKKQRGVTLIEMVLVITISGVILGGVTQAWMLAQDASRTNESISLASKMLAAGQSKIDPGGTYPVFDETALVSVIPDRFRVMSGTTMTSAITPFGGRLASGDDTTVDPVTGALIENGANRMTLGSHVWVGMHDVPSDSCIGLVRAMANAADAIQVGTVVLKRGAMDPGLRPAISVEDTCTAATTADVWFLAF